MTKKVNGYVIMSTPNVTGNRRSYGRYFSKYKAKKELKNILKNRNSMSGVGHNNPRIKKVKLFM